MWSFDVVVVGGGPGGASAAYFLKKGGAKVLVIEKKSLPRYKVCAAGVATSALEIFPFSFDKIIDSYIEKATFCYREKRITHSLPKNSLIMTMRDKLDYFLLQNADVEVWENTTVSKVLVFKNYSIIKTHKGKSVKTKYVIGADGVGSVVGKSCGLLKKQQLGLALEVELSVDEKILKEYASRLLVSFGVLKEGYFWIFPKKYHLSVGIGTIRNKERLLKPFKKVINTFLPIKNNMKIFAHPLPIHYGNYNIMKHNVFLVGDAATLVDPLTGEGIRHAILSGKIAAECIIDSTEESYPKRIKKEIGKDLIWSKRLSNFFYNHQKFCFDYFVSNKFIFKDIIKTMNNQSSYKKTLFNVPFYLVLQKFFNRT